MRILTVLLTGTIAIAWINARLPWSPLALYFTTLSFLGSYLCLTAGPIERKARQRVLRRDRMLKNLAEDENARPWSVELLCFLLGRMGAHANDEVNPEKLGFAPRTR